MRMIILFVVLLIIGLIATYQLRTHSPLPPVQQQTNVPQIPSNAQDVKAFKQDMDRFVQESAEQQRQKIDEMSK